MSFVNLKNQIASANCIRCVLALLSFTLVKNFSQEINVKESMQLVFSETPSVMYTTKRIAINFFSVNYFILYCYVLYESHMLGFNIYL